ncbi:pimeloyl-ACP methyl ester carboxylesterase [Actinoplanes campanulatus]|uniref:Pimeloyl-ACP methyl ester carboxylesterase n=1 Tax=Actinoplanes campanulatus TaxID=113559 RepID=A0A7W5ACT6_9ACTN|nr:alpha/beta hydrolase [Actinoplanes campanulatus]MBB3093928.1 pimeloyl-ACP methyl ester carboxylesterase [Actinoplanes campanulatus]GGN33700.1 alpha/beta hydrolase [Actinoplanes campanulatus]GID38377.1 alpha/beta hydrolase [Actinoplanes campanulatus]
MVQIHSTGNGPGIVVVHGGGVTAGIYRRLAGKLADRFTVHLYDRRGRGDAPARSLPYDVQEDVDDLLTVLRQTGSHNVLGHSGGGIVALLAARQGAVERLALYDGVVPVDDLFPTAWVDPARAAARAGDIPRALALTSAGINTHTAASRLPLAVQTAICRLFLRTPIGREMGELLPMTLDEVDGIRAFTGPAEQWAGIGCEVLLACGADGPSYYPRLNEALAAVLPHARTLLVPRAAHDAVNRAPARVVEPLAEFFAAPARVS